MLTIRLALRALPTRISLALASLALAALALPALAAAAKPAVLTFKVAKVGAPGNPSVGIIPFEDEIFKSCAEVQTPSNPRAPKCMEVGGVAYRYGIGQLEVTVDQYVDFLNTADPLGTNKRKLWSTTESSTAWPRF